MFEEYMNQEFLKQSWAIKKEKDEYCSVFNILKTMSNDFEGENVSEMELEEDEKNWLTNLRMYFWR